MCLKVLPVIRICFPTRQAVSCVKDNQAFVLLSLSCNQASQEDRSMLRSSHSFAMEPLETKTFFLVFVTRAKKLVVADKFAKYAFSLFLERWVLLMKDGSDRNPSKSLT